MVWRLAASLALSACSTLQPLLPIPTPAREGQEQAAWIVWHSYGREDTPPAIRWVEGAKLSCTASTGRPGFATPVGCREGFTWTPFLCAVAWRQDDFFSTTALAHEMAHARDARIGILDPNHTRPEWQPGGEVDRANGKLQEAGL